MNQKNIALIAHIYLFGWVISLLLNNEDKNEFVSFYLRQNLGFIVLSFFTWIPFIGQLLGVLIIVAWVLSMIAAAQGQTKLTPFVGTYFQEWFKAL